MPSQSQSVIAGGKGGHRRRGRQASDAVDGGSDDVGQAAAGRRPLDGDSEGDERQHAVGDVLLKSSRARTSDPAAGKPGREAPTELQERQGRRSKPVRVL